MLQVRGDVHVEKLDFLGRLVETRDIHNLPLTVGKEILLARLMGVSTLSGRPFSKTWLGSDSTAPAAGDKFVKGPLWESKVEAIYPHDDYDVQGLYVVGATTHSAAVSDSSQANYVWWPGTNSSGQDVYFVGTFSGGGLPYGDVLSLSAVIKTIVVNSDSGKVADSFIDTWFCTSAGAGSSSVATNNPSAPAGVGSSSTQSFTNSYTWSAPVTDSARDFFFYLRILPNQGVGNASCSHRVYHVLVTESAKNYSKSYADNTFALGGSAGQYIASSSHTGIAATVSETCLGTDVSTVSALNRVTFSSVALTPPDTLNVKFTVSFSEV